jgi:hypothetical protein
VLFFCHQQGPHSVEVYLKQTAIANPHVSITYQDPQGKEIHFVRCTDRLPPRPKEIKPHPHGIELGRLIQMLSNTASRSLLRFLVDEFSCVVVALHLHLDPRPVRAIPFHSSLLVDVRPVIGRVDRYIELRSKLVALARLQREA